MYDLDSRAWDFKINFFPLHIDAITLLSLIVMDRGWRVGYSSKGLLVTIELQNIINVRCHFCVVLFMFGAIFVRSFFD